MSSNLSNATLWRLGLAAAAGLWLGRKIPISVAALAGGLALALLPKRSETPRAAAPAEPSPWPEAPVVPPFVPHTQAWDDLREAISPVAHAPPLAEATDPFIADEWPTSKASG